MVEGAWNLGGTNGSGLANIQNRIEACGVELKAWGAGKLNPDAEEIKKLQKKIDTMIGEDVTEESKAEFLEVSKKLDELLCRQEIF